MGEAVFAADPGPEFVVINIGSVDTNGLIVAGICIFDGLVHLGYNGV